VEPESAANSGLRTERPENHQKSAPCSSKLYDLTIVTANGRVKAMTLTLDKMNRLVVPKSLRDRLALQPGDELEITLEGDAMRLRPLHPSASTSLEKGILVCSSEVPTAAWDISAFMEQQRDQRSRELGGI
jgi:AbrB family looped-hinge helix DNA binding protein